MANKKQSDELNQQSRNNPGGQKQGGSQGIQGGQRGQQSGQRGQQSGQQVGQTGQGSAPRTKKTDMEEEEEEI